MMSKENIVSTEWGARFTMAITGADKGDLEEWIELHRENDDPLVISEPVDKCDRSLRYIGINQPDTYKVSIDGGMEDSFTDVMDFTELEANMIKDFKKAGFELIFGSSSTEIDDDSGERFGNLIAAFTDEENPGVLFRICSLQNNLNDEAYHLSNVEIYCDEGLTDQQIHDYSHDLAAFTVSILLDSEDKTFKSLYDYPLEMGEVASKSIRYVDNDTALLMAASRHAVGAELTTDLPFDFPDDVKGITYNLGDEAAMIVHSDKGDHLYSQKEVIGNLHLHKHDRWSHGGMEGRWSPVRFNLTKVFIHFEQLYQQSGEPSATIDNPNYKSAPKPTP